MSLTVLDINVDDVTECLTQAGLTFQVKRGYIVTQCPMHQERNPSCQIFMDDWFCSCLAGCGRFSITEPFPELKGKYLTEEEAAIKREAPHEPTKQYKRFDLMESWSRLPLIPRSHAFKHIPLFILDDLGWRWDAAKGSYFIPYFDETRSSIPFAQWRHLQGDRRFTFLAGAKQTLYGKWNVSPGGRLFIVEGASDGAVLQRAGLPWVALPSASAGLILRNFAIHATKLKIKLIYGGDNDSAGDALKRALDEAQVPYRVKQAPGLFKDYGEMYESMGVNAVYDWCKTELN